MNNASKRTPEEEKTMNFFNGLYRTFLNKAVCITYVWAEGDERPESDYSSGFFVVIDELPVLVMAGHVSEGIHRCRERGTLKEVCLVYAVDEYTDERLQLSIDDLTMFWWPSEKDLDIGYLAVDWPVLERMVNKGMSAIPLDRFQAPSGDPSKLRAAIGFSASDCVETETVAFLVYDRGKTQERMRVNYLSVARRCVLMNGFQDRRNSQYVGLPLDKRELCVRGMSGGLVIEFDEGSRPGDFRVVGIQSGQAYRDLDDRTRIATKLFVTDGIYAIESIRASFDVNPDEIAGDGGEVDSQE